MKLEVSMDGGSHKWLVYKFIMENPNLTWMMTGGRPMTQETSRDNGIRMGYTWDIV